MKPSGPSNAKILIVGEAPGREEEARNMPFVGPSGGELDRMLADAGILRANCMATNVCHVRPPKNEMLWTTKSPGGFIARRKTIPDDTEWVQLGGNWVKPAVAAGIQELNKLIEQTKPELILALGNTPLWALTGKWGITDWRGSQMYAHETKVLPALHPAAILRDWSQRHITVHDFKRAKKWLDTDARPPQYQFTYRPTFSQVMERLADLWLRAVEGELWLATDIETRWGHIACFGMAWNKLEALCIPFMCTERREGFWTLEEESAIVHRLSTLLQHPNVRCIWQNGLYDVQYILRHFHFLPRFGSDTMLAQNLCWPGLPKGLDYLSSIYCQWHTYWKADGKDWHKSMQEDILWEYNCKDCVITMECHEALQSTVSALGLERQYAEKMEDWHSALKVMRRGLRVDETRRALVRKEVNEAIRSREAEITSMLGHPINIKSSQQLQRLFYTDFGFVPIKQRKTGAITTDDEALEKIVTKNPLLRPLIGRMRDLRSLGVFSSTFVEAEPDPTDGRMRCYYNPAGTETFRLSSSTDAFDSGMNLQNIPKGDEETARKENREPLLPNIRKLFAPDPGYVFFDMDLDRADLQVVVWEADDDELRAALREGVDIHSLNAKTLFNLSCSLGEVKSLHADKRDLAKRWVHGTNYGGSARTMAITCGLTVHESDRLQTRWFTAHRGIKRWHERTEAELRNRRSVRNRFGYRRFYFDRVDSVLPEALAWVPQSTVSCVINETWRRVERALPNVQILLQVHDSLAGQFKREHAEEALAGLRRCASVTIPYDIPLVIPVGIKTSEVSWGDCE